MGGGATAGAGTGSHGDRWPARRERRPAVRPAPFREDSPGPPRASARQPRVVAQPAQVLRGRRHGKGGDANRRLGLRRCGAAARRGERFRLDRRRRRVTRPHRGASPTARRLPRSSVQASAPSMHGRRSGTAGDAGARVLRISEFASDSQSTTPATTTAATINPPNATPAGCARTNPPTPCVSHSGSACSGIGRDARCAARQCAEPIDARRCRGDGCLLRVPRALDALALLAIEFRARFGTAQDRVRAIRLRRAIGGPRLARLVPIGMDEQHQQAETLLDRVGRRVGREPQRLVGRRVRPETDVPHVRHRGIVQRLGARSFQRRVAERHVPLLRQAQDDVEVDARRVGADRLGAVARRVPVVAQKKPRGLPGGSAADHVDRIASGIDPGRWECGGRPDSGERRPAWSTPAAAWLR